MEEYLPPVVTKLRADLSDMVRGLLAARVLMREYVRDVRADVVDGLRNAGRDAGLAFLAALRGTMAGGAADDLGKDVRDLVGRESVKAAAQTGAAAGRTFGAAFGAIGVPLMIAAVVLASPLIIMAVASAITAGLGLGFVGLGIFLLREQPAVVAAGTVFKDTLVKVFKDAATPMIGPIIAALGILTVLAKELGPSFKTIFAAIAPAIPALAEGLAGMVREMMPALVLLAPVMRDALLAIAEVLPDLGIDIGAFLMSLVEVGPTVVRFIKDFGAETGTLIAGLGKLIEIGAVAYNWLADFGTAAKNEGFGSNPLQNWSVALEKIGGWLAGAGGAIGGWVGGLGQKLSEAGGGISKWWNDRVADVTGWAGRVWSKITGFTDKVTGWAGALPGRIMGALRALPGQLANLAGLAFDGFFFVSGFVFARVLLFLRDMPTRASLWLVDMGRLWRERAERALGFLAGLPGRIGEFFAGMAADIYAWSLNTGAAIAKWAADTWAAIGRWYNDTRAKLVTWAIEVVKGISDWLAKLPGRALQAGKDLVATLVKWGKNAHNWLMQTGKDLLQGLIDGFWAGVDGAVSLVRRAMEKIRDGAKAALGIRSPSTVFAAMGEQSMDGYIIGLVRGRSRLGRTWKAIIGPSPPPPPPPPLPPPPPPPRVIGPAPTSSAALVAAADEARRRGGGGGDGPMMLAATINIDGQRVITALVPAAQQRKLRTGSTGLS